MIITIFVNFFPVSLFFSLFLVYYCLFYFTDLQGSNNPYCKSSENVSTINFIHSANKILSSMHQNDNLNDYNPLSSYLEAAGKDVDRNISLFVRFSFAADRV